MKNWRVRSTFGSWDVEKVHAVVARSTFGSQNVQNTSASEHFWKLRCWKSARRCGAKHISKSKVEKLRGSGHSWTFGCRFAWQAQGFCSEKTWGFCRSFNYNHHYPAFHYTTTTTTLHYTTLITLHYTTPQSTPHYTTLHHTQVHYTTLQLQLQLQLRLQLQLQLQLQLHYTTRITLHYTTRLRATPHHTAPHYTNYNYSYNYNYTRLHYTRQHYTTLPYISLHYTHYTTTNATATTLHYLHYTTTTTPLHYNYNYSCATPHYIQQLWVRWPTRRPLQPLQPFQKTQLQPPFGPSVDLLCHPRFTTTNLSYRFPILKLPPPPCALLLVIIDIPEWNIPII